MHTFTDTQSTTNTDVRLGGFLISTPQIGRYQRHPFHFTWISVNFLTHSAIQGADGCLRKLCICFSDLAERKYLLWFLCI